MCICSSFYCILWNLCPYACGFVFSYLKVLCFQLRNICFQLRDTCLQLGNISTQLGDKTFLTNYFLFSTGVVLNYEFLGTKLVVSILETTPFSTEKLKIGMTPKSRSKVLSLQSISRHQAWEPRLPLNLCRLHPS